jgi:3-hydroxymyristoyl/3-hydroxydecanoyl-(acyl carrier protein) dehydratase
MQPAGQFCVPADHPSLPGHFPGRPVVPGVVLLDETLACLPPGLVLLSAKFTTPVLPGDVVTVSARAHATGRFDFTCNAHGRPVLHGSAQAVEPQSAQAAGQTGTPE